MATEPTTKFCDSCDAEIGATEKVCPKCQTDLEELDETVNAVSKAQAVIDKRKAKEAAKNTPAPPAAPEKLKGSARLRSFGRILNR